MPSHLCGSAGIAHLAGVDAASCLTHPWATCWTALPAEIADVDGWDVYHVRDLPATRALPSVPYKRHLIAGSRIVSPQFLGSPAAPQQPDHLFPLPLACRILYAGRDECPVVHRPHGCRLPAAFAMRKKNRFLEWGLLEPSCSVLSGEKPSINKRERRAGRNQRGPLGSYGLMGRLKLTTL